jgi:hypothetical protein
MVVSEPTVKERFVMGSGFPAMSEKCEDVPFRVKVKVSPCASRLGWFDRVRKSTLLSGDQLVVQGKSPVTARSIPDLFICSLNVNEITGSALLTPAAPLGGFE